MTDAELERDVRVVLGEADAGFSILRFALEGEGFALVGLATTDAELGRVLTGARPDVIVLGGGISAAAALRARECATHASLVVVWPRDVVPVVADERVLPDDVIDELGRAVRRAAWRAHVRRRVDEAATERPAAAAPPAEVVPLEVAATPVASRRRRRRVLAAAAMLVVYAVALSTIAAAVTGVWRFEGVRGGRPPAIDRRPPSLDADGVVGSVTDDPFDGTPLPSARPGGGDGADDRRGGGRPSDDRGGDDRRRAHGRDDNPGRGHGRDDNPGRGHGRDDNPGQGHGRDDNPGRGHGRDENPGQGHGRDDPGGGQRPEGDPGNGNGNGNGSRGDERRGGRANGSDDGKGDDDGRGNRGDGERDRERRSSDRSDDDVRAPRR